MKILEEWCDENQIIVNTEKTVYKLFPLSTNNRPISVKYMNFYLKKEDPFRGVLRKNFLRKDLRKTMRKKAKNDLASSRDCLALPGDHPLIFLPPLRSPT